MKEEGWGNNISIITTLLAVSQFNTTRLHISHWAPVPLTIHCVLPFLSCSHSWLQNEQNQAFIQLKCWQSRIHPLAFCQCSFSLYLQAYWDLVQTKCLSCDHLSIHLRLVRQRQLCEISLPPHLTWATPYPSQSSIHFLGKIVVWHLHY